VILQRNSYNCKNKR